MTSMVLRFVVAGRPVSLNETYERRSIQAMQAGLRLTKAAKDYWVRVQAAAVQALGHVRCPFKRCVIIETVPHFTREADAGAVTKLVQDALQGIAYENDKVVLLGLNWKGEADPQNPRTEVTVRELSPEEDSANKLTVEIPVSVIVSMKYPTMDMILGPRRKHSKRRARLVPAVRRYGEPSEGVVK